MCEIGWYEFSAQFLLTVHPVNLLLAFSLLGLLTSETHAIQSIELSGTFTYEFYVINQTYFEELIIIQRSGPMLHYCG